MSFSSQAKRACDNVRESARKVRNAQVLEVDARIVRRTPIRDGRLRGNWNASIGAPDLSTTDAIVNLSKVIANASQNADKAELTDDIYFTNNMPYAYPVEMGSSSQAPMGMMRLSVLEAGGTIGRR